MGRVKDAQILASNAAYALELTVLDLLAAQGYKIAGPEKRTYVDARPDAVLEAPDGASILAVEIKLYRSVRASSSLIEQALRQLSTYMAQIKVFRGLLVVTSIVSSEQRRHFVQAGFPNIEIWDQEDLLRHAQKATPDILANVLDILKSIQFGTFGDIAVTLAQRAQEASTLPPAGRGEELAIALESSSSGKNKTAAKKFEVLCEDSLKLLFGGDFASWQRQARIDHGYQKMDLVARLVATTQFWQTLAHDFRTRYVIFEFKNYSGQISQNEIYTTEKYLFTSALRSVAIVIARSGISKSGTKAMNGALREQGKLIMCISMAELCVILRGFDRGEDPCNLLIERLDEMLIGIAR